MAPALHFGAEGGRAAVLPHDGPVQGAPGGTVERHQRLALVRDADGRHGPARLGEAASDLGQGGTHRLPDLDRAVLHPSRAREELRELPVGDVDHLGALVDDEGADARRAGIDGHHVTRDVAHGGRLPNAGGPKPGVSGDRGGAVALTIASGP